MHLTVEPRIKGAFCALVLAFSFLAGSTFIVSAQAVNPEGKQTNSSAAPERNWWKNAVIYQVYPRSFQDTNGDGPWRPEGLTEHLDYLQKGSALTPSG